MTLPLASRLSRRALLATAAATASALAVGSSVTHAEAVYDVWASTAGDEPVSLRKTPSAKRKKAMDVLDPDTGVRLLEGPNDEGWYRIQADGGVPGWVTGDRLAFTHHVRLAWDQNLLAGAGEWSGATSWMRHGVIATLIGAPVDGYALARYGDLVGYLSLAAVETSDGPPTDPYSEQWIDVNRSSYQVRLYIGETCVDVFDCSLGSDSGEGFYATASGTYYIYDLDPNLSYTPYAKAYIMYWAGFDPYRNNGFHGWTMDANGNVIEGGWGATGGCVATSPEFAATIYDFCYFGLRVEIHW